MTDLLINQLGLVQQISITIITLFWLYQLVISIASLFKMKEKPLLYEKTHKFMLIIPAHNEGVVVRKFS